MKRFVQLAASGLALALFWGCTPAPRLMVSPLQNVAAGTGALVASTGRTLSVAIVDERHKDDILGGGIFGPNGESGEGIYVGYVPEKPAEVASLFESSAKDAAQILGFAPGTGATLTLTIRALRIDMYRVSGFSPANCVGYALVGARLSGEKELTKELALTYFESTTPAMSMKEITREAVSRIHQLMAWEATFRTLDEAFGLSADPAAVKRLLASLDATKDEIPKRRTAFWLGHVGRGDAAVAEKLLAVVKTSKQPRFREGAAEALGNLKVAEAKGEFAAILASPTPRGDWGLKDSEQVWYLMKGLWLLGDQDVAAKVPKAQIRADGKPRKQLTDLVTFLSAGTIPPLTTREAEELGKARKNVK